MNPPHSLEGAEMKPLAAIKSTPKTLTATEQDPRWARVMARDPTADDEFFYSVATTGVYCRPSCPSRHAKPQNVRFHGSVVEAQAAGFRACQRCKPDQPTAAIQNAEAIARSCRLIEQATTNLSLAELAQAAGLSPHYFHRLFKSVTGVTPKSYALAQRAAKVRRELDLGQTVTAALYEAGFNANSRFYAKSQQWLGMTPKDYRASGNDTAIRFAVGQCSLGAILVAMSNKGVCAITLGDDPEELVRDLQQRFSKAQLLGGDKDFEQVIAQVVGLIEAPHAGLALPLDIRGTAFQQRVWQALQTIPVGTTVSYTDIANSIGSPHAVRAVAGACAANALAVAIPCHRVVRSDGALSGYRWGIERKRALLKRERHERTPR
jgi:AraC family transcriptional regulator, regulatory protein of adaptative response / methylated-DNA-[protein]-cysteine methyltransferase